MILTLTRTNFTMSGIFGTLESEDKALYCDTLEHSYPPIFIPKILAGTYRCIRGKHCLHKTSKPFDTFEVTKVPGHTGILFHIGNFNDDSNGCILLGHRNTNEKVPRGIYNSRYAFDNFMDYMKDTIDFDLEIK